LGAAAKADGQNSKRLSLHMSSTRGDKESADSDLKIAITVQFRSKVYHDRLQRVTIEHKLKKPKKKKKKKNIGPLI
jgi:hypothetical protein